MIPVTFDKILLSNVGFVVLLKSDEDKRTLPIFIGTAEAQAIALHVSEVKMPRPLTHDLMKNILEHIEIGFKRIEVCDLREGTFIARIVLTQNGDETFVDSRPSDAIALALRFDAPIFVAEEVMDEAGRVFTETEDELQATLSGESGASQDEGEKKELSPLEKLKLDLQKAVDEERYEDAARLRDDIKREEHPPSEN
jgi:bifunctional DNase/RNase